ncbi:vezatin [Megalops cyprinoides]|uniref:vezatin n=1 Tax=Megalops cyprinoides TaxID=118141 RepID=UPI001863EEE1|nr:vezatin [Megalops cyprinoides]
MTEEFDEEVVFENSPLFQYLQDLGHTDFEACATVSQEEEQYKQGGAGSPLQDAPTPPIEGRIWRLADTVWSMSFCLQGSMSPSLEQQLDAEFRQYSLRTILEQDVLLQEDVELIELLDPSVLSMGSSTSSDHALTTTAPPTPHPRAGPSLWDLSVLAAFAAVLAALQGPEGGPSMTLLVPWAAALAAFVALRGAGLVRMARLRRDMRARGVRLERLALDCRALTGLARKSLRLVQETEVISRGFTLVSAACPFNRVGQQRGQQLLGLRKASYRALRAAFRASRLATCHMLKSYPLDSEIDNVTNYVSTVPLKELGLGLGEEDLTDEQVQELTDDYSLPALKVLFQLWMGQSSEFFRRLALLLSPGREDQRGRGDGAKQGEQPLAPPAHRAVAEVTGPFQHTLSGCLGDLQRSYDFHRYFEMHHQPQASDRARRARQKCRELNTLHTSVRSLQLHLKALLNEMIILEDELEKLMVSRETVETTCAGYQMLQDRLRLLQPHMQASSACWDETVAQVDRMLNRAANCPGTPGAEDEKAPPVPPPPPRPVTLIQDNDPVPEEQELEAYVTDSDSDGEWQGSLRDLLSPEERERQRRQREESRHVLLELKSVLGLRASEAERQRWKQLLFSDRAALTAVPTEPPEPHRTSDPVDILAPENEENHHVEDHQEEEGEVVEEEEGRDKENPAPATTETEFCCGQTEVGEERAHPPASDVAEGTVHYQYDGLAGEEVEAQTDGMEHRPLVARVPALSVMDRLTELHGSAALSFSSALAAQVAARSHSFTNMEEQTFGDKDEDEEEEGEGPGEVEQEEETSQPRRRSQEDD